MKSRHIFCAFVDEANTILYFSASCISVGLADLYYQFVTVIGLPVGALAGFGIHYALNPLVFGKQGELHVAATHL